MSNARVGRISVIIPTLNESENIEAVTARVFENMSCFDVEIIVVDDGSTDGTPEKVRALGANQPVRLLERKNAKDGLAGAVMAGAKLAASDVVVVMDADLSHPPERLPELVRPVLEGSKDMIIGSRYAKGGSTPEWPWKRRMMSRAASALAWPLTDVHDSLSGFFAVRRQLLADIPADASGFKIALELLVRGGDTLRVGEIPITFRDRTHGQSKMGTRVIFTYFERLLALCGWRTSEEDTKKVLAKNLVSWALDFLAFVGLIQLGQDLATAHIASYAAASVVTYFNSRQESERLQNTYGNFTRRFLLVRLMSMFVRGGVLALIASSREWPPAIAILPAIAAGALVSYFGFAFFIWPTREQYGSGIRWRVASIGIVAYLLLLRLAYLNEIQLLPSETYFMQTLPLMKWLIHAGMALCGHNPFGMRIGALFCSFLATLFFYRIARGFFDKSTAFRTTMFVQVLPVAFAGGFFITPVAPMLAGWAAVLYLYHLEPLRRRPWTWAGVLIFAALLWPVVTNPEPRVASITPERIGYALNALLVSPLILLTPTGLAAALLILSQRPDASQRNRDLFVKTATLLSLAAFVCFCLTRIVPYGWMGVAWLPVIPSIAKAFGENGTADRGKLFSFVQAMWPATILILIIGYGAVLHYLALGLPGFN